MKPRTYLTTIFIFPFIWLAFSFLNAHKANACSGSSDSYMIIGGRCISIPSQPQNKKPQEPNNSHESYTNNDQYQQITETEINLAKKNCSDFNFQDEAQDYALENPESFLDNSDGITCSYLPWRKYGYLNKASAEQVKREFYERKSSKTFGSRIDIGMTVEEVQSIVGFKGKYIGNSTWVWGNILNPKQQLKIQVLNNQVSKVSKRGF